MYFKDNFSETHMLFSQPVTFTIMDDDKVAVDTFKMQLPTFKMFYFEDNMRQLVSLIHAPIEDLQAQFAVVREFESHYQLLLCLSLLNNQYTNRYLKTVADALKLLDLNVDFTSGGININNHVATDELMTRIFRIILISLALKKQSDFIDDPQMRALQAKIDRIKRKNQPTGEVGEHNFQQAFIVLTYEFGYKPDEILNMTQYAINTILSYTNKSIQYKLTLIAAGNGNTKKIKFITDKGK